MSTTLRTPRALMLACVLLMSMSGCLADLRAAGLLHFSDSDSTTSTTDSSSCTEVDACTTGSSSDASITEGIQTERFVRGRPTPRRPPAVVYINPPRRTDWYAGEHEVHVLTDRSGTSLENHAGEYSHSLNLSTALSQNH